MKKLWLALLLILTINFESNGHSASNATESNQLRLGVNMHPVQDSYSPNTIFQQVQLARNIGASIIAIDIHWAWLDPNHTAITGWDTTQLNRIDSFVASLANNNMQIVAIVTETPCWASSDPNKNCAVGQYDWKYPPTNPQDFADFLTIFVNRYKGSIKYWGIWGEPNTPYRWINPNATTYTTLLKAAYPAIKAIDSNAIVLSGSLAPYDGSSGIPSVFDYLSGMYAAGAKGYFDILAYNPYTDGNTPTWYNSNFPAVSFSHSVPALRQIMQNNNDSSPIWLTETGWSTVSRNCVDCWVNTLPNTEAEQAEYMVQAINIAKNWQYVEAYIAYELIDTVLPYDNQERLEYHWGLFRKDFTAKPAANQFRDLALPSKVFLPLLQK